MALLVPVLFLDEDAVSKRCCILLILSLLKRERFGGET